MECKTCAWYEQELKDNIDHPTNVYVQRDYAEHKNTHTRHLPDGGEGRELVNK